MRRLKITTVDAYFQSGGATALPTTQPTYTFTKQAFTLGSDPWTDTSSDTLLGTGTGAAASFGAYAVVHKISITGLSHTVLEDAAYHIRFTGDTNDANTGTGVLWGINITVALP